MKTLNIYFVLIVTILKLAPSLQEKCGEPRFAQVINEAGNVSVLHFPWIGAIFSLVNRTETGEAKYICGTSVITKNFAITGKWTDLIFSNHQLEVIKSFSGSLYS